MSIKKLGIRLANEANITLPGAAFAELIAFEHMRVENLRRCIASLTAANPGGADERLTEIAVHLQVMENASDGVRREHLRVARAQGLRFDIVPAAGEVH